VPPGAPCLLFLCPSSRQGQVWYQGMAVYPHTGLGSAAGNGSAMVDIQPVCEKRVPLAAKHKAAKMETSYGHR
jgi:hypothetical protein